MQVKRRRMFLRKKLNESADLYIQGKRYAAVLKDWSPGGIGLLVRGLPVLIGAEVEVRADRLALKETGTLLWNRQLDEGIRIGIGQSGKLLGNVREWRLADIINGLRLGARTGVLSVKDGRTQRRVCFQDGEVVSTASDDPEDQLGEILHAAGRISREQLEAAVEAMYETGKKIGAVLVEQQILSPQDLLESAQQHAGAIFSRLVGSTSGVFAFTERPLYQDEALRVPINIENLLVKSARSIDDPELIRSWLYDPDTIVAPLVDAEVLASASALDKQDRELFNLVDGRRSAREIISRSHAGEVEAIRSLLALSDAMVIDLSGITNVESSAAPGISAQEAPPPRRYTEQEMKIEEIFQEHRRLGHYGILGLNPTASNADVRHAYYQKVKEFHPDRYPDLDEEFKKKINAVFSFINDAYRELKNKQTAQPREVHVEHRMPEKERTKRMARERFMEGMETYSRKNYADATTSFGQAIYLDGTVPDYHYYYGLSLKEERKFRNAEESIRKALHLSPYNAEYLMALGLIYLQLGFKTRARNVFERVLQLEPKKAEAAAALKQCKS